MRIFIYLSLCFALGACKSTSPVNSTQSSSIIDNSHRSDERVNLDETWDRYKNHDLGVSMKVPKFVTITYDAKKPSIEVENESRLNGWKLLFINVDSADNLERAIQSVAGSDCLLKKTDEWREGYYPFEIYTEKKYGDSNCGPSHSAWEFIYSSTKKKILYWDGGQEYRFEKNGKAYDDEIWNSVTF